MKKSQKKAVAVGATAAALAAAAAATYFFTGKRGAKNRKKVSTFAKSVQSDVVKQLKKVKNVSEKNYDVAVDQVLKRYSALKQVDKSEILAAAKELKSHWNTISKQLKPVVKPKKKAAKKKAAAKKKVSRKKRI